MAHPKPIDVKAENGQPVRIARTSDTNITVTWVCGGTRQFTPAGLRQAIENFDLVTLYAESASPWMEDHDTAGNVFVCRLKDGRFWAHDSHREEHHVPWAKFKAALLARAKD